MFVTYAQLVKSHRCVIIHEAHEGWDQFLVWLIDMKFVMYAYMYIPTCTLLENRRFLYLREMGYSVRASRVNGTKWMFLNR